MRTHHEPHCHYWQSGTAWKVLCWKDFKVKSWTKKTKKFRWPWQLYWNVQKNAKLPCVVMDWWCRLKINYAPTSMKLYDVVKYFNRPSGYQVLEDNVDLMIKVPHQASDRPHKSIHWYHSQEHVTISRA